MNKKQLEAQAYTYSACHQKLEAAVDNLNAKISLIKAQHKAHLLNLVSEAAKAKQNLIDAINENPELFEKPRTQTLHGIKFGLQKQKGKTVIADEAKTIKKIRDLLPEDQGELLITVKESVHKSSVSDLTAADLKRLGITIESDTDKAIVKVMAGDVEKLVDALLDTDEREAA